MNLCGFGVLLQGERLCKEKAFYLGQLYSIYYFVLTEKEN